ncbi:hypothetical protein IQ273_12905 [Nodosilinea sp. LEGE 07298]|uniref:hypothetical protein n=1 Tax=Nodosilinea sp. LEGE 07298 TaxID=2777970 RepID=UPI0018824936|nr:hypothetical protein [Nodosilinea sp. LEGE 07298]MBE9110312.1 hypothetical protein [Nodosilinea sp. LEGE 07298]
MTTQEIRPGQSLSSLAGSLYGDTSYFRELAEQNNIDIFNPESLAGLNIEVPSLEEVKAQATSAIESTLSQLNIQSLDLSAIRGPASLSASQLIEWLL